MQVQSLQFELREIRTFMGFLDTLHQKLTLTEATFDAVGPIEFARCPGCGATLDPDTPKNCCIVCKSSLNEETETARYNHIRIDIEIQTRESRQLANRKLVELKNTRRKLGQLRRGYERVLSAFDLEYASRNGPETRFLQQGPFVSVRLTVKSSSFFGAWLPLMIYRSSNLRAVWSRVRFSPLRSVLRFYEQPPTNGVQRLFR